MIANEFSYSAPTSLSDAYAQKTASAQTAYLAGGTDYVPLMKNQLKAPRKVISLDKIDSLKRIDEGGGKLFIGSMVSLRNIYENEMIARKYPSLASAARKVASPQIRSVGTLGGNILQDRRCLYFNQSADWRINIEKCYKLGGSVCLQAPRADACRALYYSDIAPVLISLDAEAELYDNGMLRKMPICQLVREHIKNNGSIRTHNYILTGFYLPEPSPGTQFMFEKYSIRASLNFPVMNVAVRYDLKSECPCAKIVVGAVAPLPVVLTDTEDMILKNRDRLFDIREEIAQTALSELTRKSAIVRETGLSVKAKRNSFKNILNIIDSMLSDPECKKHI